MLTNAPRPASRTSKRGGQGSQFGQTAAGIVLSARATVAQSVRQGLQSDSTDLHPSSPPQAQTSRNPSKRRTNALNLPSDQTDSQTEQRRPSKKNTNALPPDQTDSHPSSPAQVQAPQRSLYKRNTNTFNFMNSSDQTDSPSSAPSQAQTSQRTPSKRSTNAWNMGNSLPAEGLFGVRRGSDRPQASLSGQAGALDGLTGPVAWHRQSSESSESSVGSMLLDDELMQFVEQAVPSAEHRQEVLICIRSLLTAVRRAHASANVDKDMLADVLGPVLWRVSGLKHAKSSRLPSKEVEAERPSSSANNCETTTTTPRVAVGSKQETPLKSSGTLVLDSSRAEAEAEAEEQIVRFDFYQKVYQGLHMQGNLITRMTQGNAFEKKGVKEKWRVLAVDSLPVKDYEELRAAVDLRRKMHNRVFKISFEADTKAAALHREKQRVHLWRTLQGLRPEDKIDFFSLERNREAVLRDRDATLALLGQGRVHELEVLLGTATAAEIEQLEELLAFIGVDDSEEVRRMVSNRLVSLRDRDGLRAAHHVQSELCAEIVLQAGPPQLVREVSAHGQSAATMMAARGINIDKVLMNWDLPSMLAIDACGMSVAMHLEHEQWEQFSCMLPTWEDWLEALLPCSGIAISQVVDALARIEKKLHAQGLVTDCEGNHQGVIAALHLACFAEPIIWREGRHTDRSSERLRKVGSTIVGLFGMLSNNPSAVHPLRILMSATKGPKHSNLDPREPWRYDLDDAVAAYEQSTRVKLDELAHAVESQENGWLLTVDDTMLVTGPWLRLDSKLEGCPSWEYPKWIETCDFEAAAKELGVEAVQSVLELGFEGRTISGLERYEMTFARLHGFSRREFCQQHVGLVRDFFLRVAIDHGCTLHARQSAKALSRILVKASAVVDELKTSGVQPSKDELKTAGDYVTDINGVEMIAGDVPSLRRICEWCMSANWKMHGAQILRLKNSFTNISSSGYRDLKVWMLVNISETPLVVEVQLLLDSMYQFKEAMHVAYEYRRGSFDHAPVESKGKQSNLQRTMRGLDLDHPAFCTADEWCMKLLNAIDDLNVALNAEKEELTASGLKEQVENNEELAAGKELLELLRSRKSAREELNSALDEGSDGAQQVADQTLQLSADRSFSAIKAHQRLLQARSDAVACGLKLSLDGFDTRCDCVSSELLAEALREAEFDLNHARSLIEFDAAVANAGLFEVYACTDFDSQRTPFLKKAQDATQKIMASVNDESLLRQLLMDSGDPNFIDNRGRNPLQLAVQQTLVTSTRTLIEFKADAGTILKFGNSLLHRVLESQATTDTLQIASELISGRADLNCANDDGWCPLHCAARQQEGAGVEEAAQVDMLLKTKKVRINACLPATEGKLAGASPLHVAVSAGNYRAVTLLVHGKADLNSMDSQRRTPLFFVVNFQQDQSFADFLVKMQANLGNQDVDGNTALHLSAAAGAVRLVQLFLDANADVNQRNKLRQTPLRYLQEKNPKGQKEVGRLLQQHGGR